MKYSTYQLVRRISEPSTAPVILDPACPVVFFYQVLRRLVDSRRQVKLAMKTVKAREPPNQSQIVSIANQPCEIHTAKMSHVVFRFPKRYRQSQTVVIFFLAIWVIFPNNTPRKGIQRRYKCWRFDKRCRETVAFRCRFSTVSKLLRKALKLTANSM